MLATGNRVESSPATDAWIMGDRFGTVVKVGTKWIHILMDRSGKVRKFSPENVVVIDAPALKCEAHDSNHPDYPRTTLPCTEDATAIGKFSSYSGSRIYQTLPVCKRHEDRFNDAERGIKLYRF